MHINFLKYIYSHPFLAASIVGSLIHTGKWFNYTVHGISYYDNVMSFLNIGNTFFIINITIPFLIPFIVITVSRYIAQVREDEFYESFPDMNPDLIIKCDISGVPVYINDRARELLLELNIPNEEEMLIPKGLMKIKNESNTFPYTITHNILGKKIEYTANKSEENIFFLSGRISNENDITK